MTWGQEKIMGTQCKAISIAMLLGTMVVMVPSEVSGYDEDPHRYIVAKALECYAGTGSTQPGLYWQPLTNGAYNEDMGDEYGTDEDHIFHYWCDGAAISTCTYPHFWDYDGDNGISGLGIDDLFTIASDDWPNAWMKVSGYRVSQFGNLPKPTEGQGLWQDAIMLYRLGNHWQAYERLGHVCHLLADMSVPAHVHEDAHPDIDSDPYEDTISENITAVLSVLDPAQLNDGLITIPVQDKNKTNISDELWPLFYLMYTTNQRADFFASDDDTGDGYDWLGLVDYSKWPQPDLFVYANYYQYPSYVKTPVWHCWVCGAVQCVGDEDSSCRAQLCINCFNSGRGPQPLHMANPQWVIAERVTLVYAVRATATLLEVFLKEADPVAPATSIAIGLNKYITSNNDVYISPETKVTLTASDDAAGVEVTGYRVKGGGYDSDWKVYSAPFTLNQVQAGLADGPYTILYRSADYADNLEGDKSKDVYLTTQPADYRVRLSTGGSYLGIQAAIDAASNDSTLEVKSGVFRECIDFKGKAIVLRSIGGAEVTTIDAAGGLHVVTFANAEGANSILDGFTITGGNASGVGFPDGCGAGILCNGTQPIIRNCIITNNYAASDGGGVYIKNLYPVLHNCLIYNNNANNGGGLLSNFSQPTIANCTFSANLSRAGLGGAIASFANAAGNTPILYNCILSGDSPWEIIYSTVSPFVWNCDIQQNAVWVGGNNLNADPIFVDAAHGNFHLKVDSPCIGVGTNNATYPGETDLDGYPRILDGKCNGTAVVDMGAYEFSYANKGDLDGNCIVNFADLAILAAEWMAEPADRTNDIAPGPAGDGAINILDFAVLAEHWMKEKP
jgi:hypothetical protein